MKIQVGQVVYLKKSRIRQSQVIEAKITSVGRKYFTVEQGFFKTRLFIDGMCEVNCSGLPWNAYLSMKEVEEEDERKSLGSFLCYTAEYSRLSLDQMRRIKAILEEGKK